MGAAFTPGPWYAEKLHTVFSVQSASKSIAVCSHQGRAGRDGTAEANARLIAAAPELYEAAQKHLEWIQKEHDGPQYGKLTRDTHPLGEAIWKQWWNEQLDLCAETEALCRAALAKARGEQ